MWSSIVCDPNKICWPALFVTCHEARVIAREVLVEKKDTRGVVIKGRGHGLGGYIIKPEGRAGRDVFVVEWGVCFWKARCEPNW